MIHINYHVGSQFWLVRLCPHILIYYCCKINVCKLKIWLQLLLHTWKHFCCFIMPFCYGNSKCIPVVMHLLPVLCCLFVSLYLQFCNFICFRWVSKLIRKRHDSSVTSVAWHPDNVRVDFLIVIYIFLFMFAFFSLVFVNALVM